MNPAAERILGKTREEFLGQTPASVEHDTFHEDGTAFPGREHPASAALQTGVEVRDVVMGVRHPHEPRLRWINITATPLFRTGEATPYEVYTIFDDITARREADLQVRSLNAQLDARAQALESTNRELESFSYSVSHDLRAPLRSIDGFSRALLEDYSARLDDEGRDFLNRIRGASQRMGQLIDDLLHLSQVTRNEMRLGPVDLSGLAVVVADTLRQANPERRIEFDIAAGLHAYADARLLQLVLENLFGNAVKFSSKRPVGRIQFGRTERNNGTAFFVRDNGAGFDPATAVKLFGAFQRFHTAAEFPGTGIGLATVQRIIHRHGGRLEVESQPDQGATFFFTLPGQPPPSS
jgi:light-regulated signal transduction histidine kinase (bacteriophytochrome)